MIESKYPTVVVAKQTNDVYQYHGDDVYENVVTGVQRKCKPEDAAKWFRIPIVLNAMCMINPLLVGLIKAGKFKYDGLLSDEKKDDMVELISRID